MESLVSYSTMYAAWAQALGSIAALGVGFWLVNKQARHDHELATRQKTDRGRHQLELAILALDKVLSFYKRIEEITLQGETGEDAIEYSLKVSRGYDFNFLKSLLTRLSENDAPTAIDPSDILEGVYYFDQAQKYAEEWLRFSHSPDEGSPDWWIPSDAIDELKAIQGRLRAALRTP